MIEDVDARDPPTDGEDDPRRTIRNTEGRCELFESFAVIGVSLMESLRS